MNELARQLGDLNAAGSYKLDCSKEDLRNAVDQAGFALFEADLHGVRSKKNLLNVLAEATHIPSWFGANWDALADALCDLSWHKADGYVLLLHNAPMSLGLSAHDREIAHDIFARTADYWRQRGKPFWIFFA